MPFLNLRPPLSAFSSQRSALMPLMGVKECIVIELACERAAALGFEFAGPPIPRATLCRLPSGVKSEDRPEWRLVKASIIAGSAFAVTAAVGDFHEFTPRLIEQWIRFGTAFDGARFRSVGSEGHQIARQGQQQILP